MEILINYLRQVLILLCLFVFCLIFSIQADSKDFTIFFIHGLQGDSKSFCDFPDELQSSLVSQLGPEIKFNLVPLDYDTLNKTRKNRTTKLRLGSNTTTQSSTGRLRRTQSVDNFKHQINAQIAAYYADQHLPIDSPYAIVAHSQGGLITTKYVNKCVWQSLVDGQDQCSDQDKNRKLTTPKNLTHVFSLGTPHQGSPGANFLKEGLTGLFKGVLNWWSGTPNQVTDLSVGSSSIYQDREFLLQNMTPQGWQTPYRKVVNGKTVELNTRFYNLIGNIEYDNLSLIGKVFTGSLTEADIVVDVTSARQDFNYCLMSSPESDLTCGKTNIVNSPDLSIIDRAHTLEPPLVKFEEDLKCVWKGEPHPSLNFVTRKLVESLSPVEAKFSKPYQGQQEQILANFTTEINVFFPKWLKRGPNRYQTKIEVIGGDTALFDRIKIPNDWTRHYNGYNDHSDEIATGVILQNRLTYYHHGRIKPDLATILSNGMIKKLSPELHLRYRITHPGFDTLELDLPIEVSKTTFTKVYLKPYRPLEAQDYTGEFKKFKDLPQGVCYPGILTPTAPAGRPLSVQVYDHFMDPDLKKKDRKHDDLWNSFVGDPRRMLRVLGRFKRGDVDRYLVIKEAPQYEHASKQHAAGEQMIPWFDDGGSIVVFTKSRGWIARGDEASIGWANVNDVDIIKGVNCPQFVD